MMKIARLVGRLLLALLLGGVGHLLLPARGAAAATLTVSTTADELDTNRACSLREALRAADTNQRVGACPAGSATGSDTIRLPAGTYQLTRTGVEENGALTGDLDVTGDVRIIGADAPTTVIDGNASDRVFAVRPGATLRLARLTVHNGRLDRAVTTGLNGGGIWNAGTLTLERVTVSGNLAHDQGGGIWNQGILRLDRATISGNEADSGGGVWNSGTLTAQRSTFTSNTAGTTGGGLTNDPAGTVTLTDSTVRSNWSRRVAAGIQNRGRLTVTTSTLSDNSAADIGGLGNTGSATLTNSTVSGNRTIGRSAGIENRQRGTLALVSSTVTANRADLDGGGLLVQAGTVTLANTIIAGNLAGDLQRKEDCVAYVPVRSAGYNLIGTTERCPLVGDRTGNRLHVDARLGPLQHNGGPTATHAPLPGSPVIDAGHPAAPGSSNPACPPTDQRGVPRPQDGNADATARCDIGAVERERGGPAPASTVWGWGNNAQGQLGIGSADPTRLVPVPVPNLTGVTAIAAGYYHSLALKTDGTVWAWGLNANGQLGNGSTASSTTPVRVPNLTGVTAVAGGGHHSLALKTDGTVVAWGANHSGELGSGIISRGSTTPVPVSGLSGVTRLVAGANHNLAVTTDGQLWSWGGNHAGQLGIGSTSASSVPVAVRSLTNVTALAAGGAHSLAAQADGTLWAWGRNTTGQLGIGQSPRQTQPVQVAGLREVTGLAAHIWHSLAVTADGTVWAWGSNTSGQLGNGATGQGIHVPIIVSGLSGARQLAAGTQFSLALQAHEAPGSSARR